MKRSMQMKSIRMKKSMRLKNIRMVSIRIKITQMKKSIWMPPGVKRLYEWEKVCEWKLYELKIVLE